LKNFASKYGILRKIAVFAIGGLLLFCGNNLFAANRYSVASGNWSSTSTWSATSGGAAGVSAPVAGDAVYIERGYTVTVDANAACASITFTGTGATPTLTVNSGVTLTLTSTITLNSIASTATACSINGTGTITGCTGLNIGTTVTSTATVTTILTFTDATINTSALTLIGSNNNGNCTTGAGPSSFNNPTLNFQSGIINVSGTFSTATLRGSTATFNMNSGSASGTLNLSGAININSGGCTATNTMTFSGGTQTVNYKGTAAQIAIGTTYNILKVNNTAGVTLGAAASVANLTIGDETTNSIFSDGGNQISSTGTLNLVSGTFKLGATTATTWPTFATNNISPGTTIEYASAIAQTISSSPTYYNLTCSAASGTKTFDGAATIIGTFSISGANKVIMNSTSSPRTFNIANVNLSAGTLDNCSSTYSGIGTIINITGSYTQTATSTYTTLGSGFSKIVFTGGGNTTYSNAYTTAVSNWVYGLIQVSDNTTLTLSTDLMLYGVTGGGILTVDAGSTLIAGTKLIKAGSASETWVINGILKTANTAGLDGTTSTTIVSANSPTLTLGTTSTIEYNSSAAAQTVTAHSNYANLTINNTFGSACTLAGASSVAGVLSMTNGKLTTTPTNLLTIINTAPTAVAGGSTTSFIDGPLLWNMSNYMTAGYSYFFPVGKSTTYYPFTLTNPVTGNIAPTVKVEAFAASSGGSSDGSLTSLSTTEYWKVDITGDYIDGTVSLTRQTSLGGLDAIGRSNAQGGPYTSIDGIATSPSINNSNLTGSSLGYFVMATRVCSVPSINTEPADAFICGSNSTSISIIANNATAYLWKYSPDGSSWSNVADGTPTNATYTGSSSATLGITSTGIATGTYYYNCVASNTCASITFNASKLTVNTAVPPLCASTPSPSNGATTISTTPTLSWSAVSTAVVYDLYLSNTNPPTYMTTTSSTSYTPPSLSATTTYYWYVVPVNGCGATTGCGTSALWSFTTLTPTYCTPVGTGGYPITRLIFAGIDNSSTSTVAYENFTSTVPPAVVVPGSSYAITVYATGISSSYTFYDNVFIDWNQNGVFTDTDESVNIGTSASAASTLTAYVTVPAGASTGTTRIRVIHKYNAYSTSCPTSGNIQVEDYLVNVCNIDPGTINSTSMFSCTEGSTKTISISGYSSGTSIQWQQSIDNISFSNVTGGSGGTTDTYTTASLSAGTYYYRAKVSGGCDSYSSTCIIVVNTGLCPISGNFPTSFETCDVTLTTDKTTGSAISVSDATAPNFGSKHASLTGTTGGGSNGAYDASFITPIMNFIPGRVYTISAYARGFSGCPGIPGKIKFVKSSTATNTAMKAATGNDVIMGSTSMYETYSLFSANFTVSVAESKYIGIQLYFAGLGGCSGTGVYIDDIYITSSCTQCSDGIQNGDETSVDCGGTSCLSGTAAGGTVTPSNTNVTCGGGSFTLCLSGSSGNIQWQYSSDNSTWYNIGANGNNTTYYSVAYDNGYYRAKLTYDGCGSPAYSNVSTVTMTGTSSLTWNGTVSSDWNNASNWTPNTIPSSCTDVTLPSGAYVELNGIGYCHDLTIASNALLYLKFPGNNDNYLHTYGNFVNDGKIKQQTPGYTSNGVAYFKWGLQMHGNVTWGGVGTYDSTTIRLADAANVYKISNSNISILDVTIDAIPGNISLNTYTLKIRKQIQQKKQSATNGSAIHVNTGYLWLAITEDMSISPDMLFPDFGTVFFDLTGGWVVSGNWNLMGGTGFYNLILKNTGSSTLMSCNLKVRNDLTVMPGTGSVAFQYYSGSNPLPPYNCWIEGDFINNGGATVDGNFTHIFDGSDVQSIGGTSSTIFNNLKINNTSVGGVTLNNKEDVYSILTLIDGIIHTTASNLLTVYTAGLVVGASNSCHVNGPVAKNTNTTTAFNFPTGDGTYYRLIGITPSSTSFTTWTAEYHNSGYGNYAVISPLNAVTQEEYWTLDRSGTSNGIVKLSWNQNSGITTFADLVVSHYKSGNSKWENSGGMNLTGSSFSGTVQSNYGWSTYSPFTLGSLPSNAFSHGNLPVELISFNATCVENEVKLNWSTSSETNNDYFSIYKTKDFYNWYDVGTVAGSGTTNTLHLYNITDYAPFSGISYYRLKQVDYDGNSKTYDPVLSECIDLGTNTFEIISVIPNETNDELRVTYNIPNDGKVDIYLVNIMGQQFKNTKNNSAKGLNSVALSLRNPLAIGIYMIAIECNDKVFTQKIFIK